MSDQAVEQGVSKQRGRRSVHWRRDGAILARLRIVERRHLAGLPNVAIAVELDVDEITIRRDIERLRELWLEQTRADQASVRARVLAELDDVRMRALEAAEWDQLCERAVLFNDLDEAAEIDEDAPEETPKRRRRRSVYRDDKGSAQFRGNKAAALQVARQATMDKAKVYGIAIDKHEFSGPNGGPIPVNSRLTDLSDDELDRRLAELDERAAALLAGAEGGPAPNPGGAGGAAGGAGPSAP